MTISKSEREELRRIVRGDFKALRMEIGVRQTDERCACIWKAPARPAHESSTDA